MQAMIFAAGLGTRLRPLTDTLPKALVPVGGEPLIAHVIRRLTAAGARRIVVNVHHLAPLITRYLEEHPVEGVPVLISDETERLLDTGGGIRRAAPLFEPGLPVLIHNVDILSDAPLSRLYRLATAPGAPDAVLLVSDRQTQRYLLFDEEMRLVGWTNTATGEVRTPYPGLDPTRCRRYAFAGIHVIGPRLIREIQETEEEVFGIIGFYLAHCLEMRIQGHREPDLRLLDIGKHDTLTRAGEFLARLEAGEHAPGE